MFRTLSIAVALTLMASFAAVAWAEGPKVGEKAPDFTLKDAAGKDVSLSSFAGKTVVLEWINPECPFVQRHYNAGTMKQTAQKYAGQDVVWLAVSSTASAKPAQLADWSQKYSLNYPILMDNSGQVGKQYSAKTTPHMYVINKAGVLVYDGAIDNDPSGSRSDRTNYVAAALDESLAGKSVSQPQTKPYGCSVKYAN